MRGVSNGNCFSISRRNLGSRLLKAVDCVPLTIPMPSTYQFMVRVVVAAILHRGELKAAQLSDWRASSNSFSFHLLCESNEYYLVQYSTNLTNWANYRYIDGRSTNRAMNVPTGGSTRFWQAVR